MLQTLRSVLPLLLLGIPHFIHNSVLGFRFRYCCFHARVLLVHDELFCAASPTEFSAAFGPCEELCQCAFDCKSNDQ